MKNRLNGWWIAVGILGSLLIVFGIFYLTYNRMVVKKNISINKNITVSPTVTPTPDPLAPYSILLLGYGGGTHDGGLLTDTIMLAQIRPKDNEIRLISIPRDLWSPLQTDGDNIENKKINEAYAIGSDNKKYPNKKIEFTGKAGGGEMAKYTVEQVTGIKPNYFVAIDFDGFIKIIDNLGGVDVKVNQTFDDQFYPIEELKNDTCGKSEEEMKLLEATMSGDKLEQQYTCRYELLHFDKGVQHMDGTTALKFVRSRHSVVSGGDYYRAERQKVVITAVRDKVINIDFISKIIPTFQTLTKHITTDIDLTKMSELVSKAEEISKYKIISIALTDQNVLVNDKANTGQFILNPKFGENNWTEIHQFIENKGVATTSAALKQ